MNAAMGAAESATEAVVAAILADPDCRSFPADVAVFNDGKAVSWRVCDAAFVFARCGAGGSMFARWIAAVPRALAIERQEREAFLRDGEPFPLAAYEPDRAAYAFAADVATIKDPLRIRTR